MLADVKKMSAPETRTNLENQNMSGEQEWCSINGVIARPMTTAVVSGQLGAADFLMSVLYTVERI